MNQNARPKVSLIILTPLGKQYSLRNGAVAVAYVPFTYKANLVQERLDPTGKINE